MNASETDFMRRNEPLPDHPFEEDSHPHIQLREDGVYQWTCELDRHRKPHLLFHLMAMILTPVSLVSAGFLFLSFRSGISFSGLVSVLRLLAGVLIAVTAIIVFSCLIIRKASGTQEVFTYEMNDYGIRLKPAKNSPPVDLHNSADTSVFRSVRTIRIEREQHFIALNSWFLYNLIWCDPEDFDFVADYITERCVRAVILKH